MEEYRIPESRQIGRFRILGNGSENKSAYATARGWRLSRGIASTFCGKIMKRRRIFISAGILLMLTGVIYWTTQPGNLVGIDDTVIVVAEFHYLTMITFSISLFLFIYGCALSFRKNREPNE